MPNTLGHADTATVTGRRTRSRRIRRGYSRRLGGDHVCEPRHVARRGPAGGGDPDPLPARPVPARLEISRRLDDGRRLSLGLRRPRGRRAHGSSRQAGAASRRTAPGRPSGCRCALPRLGVRRGRARTAAARAYPWRTHGVTAAKFAEYALLAPAVPLLRGARDLLLSALVARAWSAPRRSSGSRSSSAPRSSSPEQWAAGRPRFSRRRTSRRSRAPRCSSASSPSPCRASPRPRLGGDRDGERRARDDRRRRGRLGARARHGARRARRRAPRCAASSRRGALVTSAPSPLVVARRVVAIRGSDLDAFARFLGASPGKHDAAADEGADLRAPHAARLARLRDLEGPSGARRRLGRLGRAGELRAVSPCRARRFPNEAPLAFPSAAPDRRYGVQNSWIQALADLGVVGLALWLAVFASRRLGRVTAARDGHRRSTACSPPHSSSGSGRRRASSPASRSTRSPSSRSGLAATRLVDE